MDSLFRSPPAVWAALIICGALSANMGCRHTRPGGSVDSSGILPESQPYDSPLESQGSALHEPLPDLSPVPPIPGAGHSASPEPVLPPSPPPAPAEPMSFLPTVEERSVNTASTPSNTRAVESALPRTKAVSPTRGSTELRPGRHAAPSRLTIAQQQAPHGVATRPPQAVSSSRTSEESIARQVASDVERSPSGNVPIIESVSGVASVSSSRETQTTGTSRESGPVITPLATPEEVRRGVVEPWPHRRQLPVSPNFHDPARPQKAIREEAGSPGSVGTESKTLPPPAAADPARVPVMLPPGV